MWVCMHVLLARLLHSRAPWHECHEYVCVCVCVCVCMVCVYVCVCIYIYIYIYIYACAQLQRGIGAYLCRVHQGLDSELLCDALPLLSKVAPCVGIVLGVHTASLQEPVDGARGLLVLIDGVAVGVVSEGGHSELMCDLLALCSKSGACDAVKVRLLAVAVAQEPSDGDLHMRVCMYLSVWSACMCARVCDN